MVDRPPITIIQLNVVLTIEWCEHSHCDQLGSVTEVVTVPLLAVGVA